MADIKFEIKETIGIIAESVKGCEKELNLLVGMVKKLSMI